MKKKLDRALGLYSAITISVGTMIGSAIFVLAGTSFQVAGPSASLAIFLAGVGAFFTAFSFAELVTIVPYSGGGYVYARDASGNGLFGFITGWGFWLGYAMSCGLFALGFGNFLHYFFPSIPVMAGAYSLILYVMITNVKGAKNTGWLQNIITTGLLILLGIYIFRGAFFADLSIQRPFMPHGFGGMFTAMGFLYITYEGFGLITTVSEEVVNPKKVIPKAIIISLITVTLIKTAVFFLSSSIIRWDMLIPNITSTPLTDISVKIGGRFGGHLFAFAGILAMVSSINTAMMAASRTCFAMARDNHLPAVFKNINSKTQTPVVSIIVVFLLVVISTGIRDLKHISTVTSLFVLTGYSFVNVALMIFRKKMPKVKRAYKVPFYPLTPIAGTAVNIFLVIRLMISNPVAVSIALGITLLGIAYYYFVLPKLKEAPKAFSAQPLPHLQADSKDIEKKYKILLPVASPYSVGALVDISVKIASSYRGTVHPVHIVKVADTIQLNSEYDDLDAKNKKILDEVEKISKGTGVVAEPILIFSRDIFASLKNAVRENCSDIVILGWHSSGLAYRMLNGMVHRALEEIPAEIGIFKKGKNKQIAKILYPYGGGAHSQETAQIIKRLSESTEAKVTFLHTVDRGTPKAEIEKIRQILKAGLDKLEVAGEMKIAESNSMVDSVIEESKNFDLVVMGASGSWGIGGYLTGGKTDRVMEKISCSGLIIRKYDPILKKRLIRRIYSRIKEFLME